MKIPRVLVLFAVSSCSCGDRPAAPATATTKEPYYDPPAPKPAPESAPPPDAADKRTPSGFFLVSAERLAALRAGAGGKAWEDLKSNAEEAIKSFDRGRSGTENVAFTYVVTRDKRFAEGAFQWWKRGTKDDVRDDSYLGFGDLMRKAAIVLNWCGDALSAEQQNEIADYLEKWTNELWFANKGSGWGLKDPGNNYYCGFVEGTSYAGYALQSAKRPAAKKIIELARDKIENGTLAYLAGPGRGGDWHEGSNYGERAKERLFSAFAAIASMGGPNYFAKSPFANDSILYALYQVQPGRKYLAPMGDLSRESVMDVTPFDRDYMQIATYWTDDPKLRGLGAWYLNEVAPGYVGHGPNIRYLLYRDVIFPTPTPATPPASLPLSYRSAGTDWINARSAWTDGATSVTIEGVSDIKQSHAHFDTGSFVIWRGGWQAADATSYGKSGLNWEAQAHNMIVVAGHQRESLKSRGLVHFEDQAGVAYAQIDGSKLFTKRSGGDTYEPLLDEWTRELVYVRPDTLVVYDRVVPRPGSAWSWRVHFPEKPSAGPERTWTARHETGSITAAVLDGGEPKIAADTDLPEGASTAWRLELGPTPAGRTLAVLRAGGITPPGLAVEPVNGAAIQGAAFDTHVVVFSKEALGKAVAMPFSYRIRDRGKRQHVLVNVAGGFDVDVTRDGGFVVVKVSAGSKLRADEHGVLRFDG
jgi:hypothetical protein